MFFSLCEISVWGLYYPLWWCWETWGSVTSLRWIGYFCNGELINITKLLLGFPLSGVSLFDDLEWPIEVNVEWTYRFMENSGWEDRYW